MTASEFKQMIMDCSDIMWQAAASMMQSQSEAQDVVADTVEKLWRVRERLPEVENVKGYVVTAVRRTALDVIRTQTRRGTMLDLEEAPALRADPAYDPQQKLERLSELELLRDIIAALPRNQRRVMELTAFRGLDNGEVARVTGLSIENVRVLLSRGRARLREAYRRFYR